MIPTRQLRQAAAVLLVLASACACGLAWGYARDKSDVVMLRNGDRLSGDIVSLEFGILTLKTDNMSTLSIEWPAVRSVTAASSAPTSLIGTNFTPGSSGSKSAWYFR